MGTFRRYLSEVGSSSMGVPAGYSTDDIPSDELTLFLRGEPLGQTRRPVLRRREPLGVGLGPRGGSEPAGPRFSNASPQRVVLSE